MCVCVFMYIHMMCVYVFLGHAYDSLRCVYVCLCYMLSEMSPMPQGVAVMRCHLGWRTLLCSVINQLCLPACLMYMHMIDLMRVCMCVYVHAYDCFDVCVCVFIYMCVTALMCVYVYLYTYT